MGTEKSNAQKKAFEKRDQALDMFRGLAVFIMILVDAPPDFQSIYPILVHSPWQGITLADLAFPGFVLCMGISAAFSVKNRQRIRPQPESDRKWGRRILRRAAMLFLIGVLFNALPSLFAWILVEGYDSASFFEKAIAHGRLFGVLQRLALTYVAGMFCILFLKKSSSIALLSFGLLFLSSAGFHLYAPEAPFDKAHNISRAVDLIFPGAAHTYPYSDVAFDPEGLYGTISSTASMLLGVLAGRIMTGNATLKQKSLRLFLLGCVLLVSGGLWSFFDIISKPLWTSPYALLTSGLYLLVLALTLLLPCSVRGYLRPFCAFGGNPLFFYIATNVFLVFLWVLPSPVDGIPSYVWLWQQTTQGFFSPAFSSALHAFLWCILWCLPAEVLYRKGIVIKL